MKCKIGADKEVFVHNTIHNAAYHFKERLVSHYEESEEIEGISLEKMAVFTFLAFTVEAHANFIASVRKIPKWEDRLGWKNKLKALLKEKEHGFDWNKPPLSEICKLFEFRDFLAHGRPFSDSIEKEVDVEVADEEEHRELIDLAAPWEKLLEEIDYKTAYTAVDDLWKKLLELYSINLVETLDGGSYQISYSGD